jgi:hypothetical protein
MNGVTSVLDIGKANVKVATFACDGALVWERTMPNRMSALCGVITGFGTQGSQARLIGSSSKFSLLQNGLSRSGSVSPRWRQEC